MRDDDDRDDNDNKDEDCDDIYHHPDGHHHLFLVLICISKVTLDSIGNAEDATMIVIITVSSSSCDENYHRSIPCITSAPE